MSRAGLSYGLVPGGDVALTVRNDLGHVATVVLSRSKAVARAWAILNDLDPDGVIEVAHEGSALATATGPIPAVNIRGGLCVRILMALERGPATQARIRQLTGLAVNQVSGTCHQMRVDGRIKRLDSGVGLGSRATWAYTADGLRWLEPRRPLS